MARKRDLTTTTDPKFGPWRPMRGARGQAEAIQQKIGSPFRTASPQSPLVPGRANMLKEGADHYAARRMGGRRS